MSLDRELTTKVFHPLGRAKFWDKGLRVPILTYHSLSQDSHSALPAASRTATDPFTFRQQMRSLITSGCNPVDLSQVVRWLQEGRLPAGKSVVITFDDGLRDFYTHALPVLQELSFPATVFLPTGFIAASRRSHKKAECLTWAEVREIHKAGIRLGSHSVSHADLSELPRVEMMRELAVSKAEIERQIGAPAVSFSYPHGFPKGKSTFAAEFRDLLVKTGYSCCVTSDLGRVKSGDDLYRLKRMPINTLDVPKLFQAKLEGGYDWLGWTQPLLHKLKRKQNPKTKA